MADKKEKESEPSFFKAQLMMSEKYASRRDLIGALLCDDKEYTIAQVDAAIENYLKGTVI